MVDGVHKYNIIINLVPEIKYLYKIQDFEQVLNKPKLKDVPFIKHKKFKLNEDETGLVVCIEPFWMGNDNTLVDREIIIN